MATRGFLEIMVRADLDTLLDEIGRDYRAGALEAHTAADPAWRAALDQREREVGALYQTLGEADAAFLHWRRAVAELRSLWGRVHASAFEEVA